MADDPSAGETITLAGIVEEGRTAASLAAEGERLPAVFGTPFMIADMERACAAILAPLLNPGEVSVGARIEVVHNAPTPLGAEVSASARYTGREGPLYWFEVWAEDSAGRIGEGRIARAIVPEEKLVTRAETRR
ncbi:thioesterase [Algihabitans albus]|uniref:thioesterase family protein n=1 Tax=Algihabitans albus TaxID=2164067 RepID=UPI0035CEE07C